MKKHQANKIKIRQKVHKFFLVRSSISKIKPTKATASCLKTLYQDIKEIRVFTGNSVLPPQDRLSYLIYTKKGGHDEQTGTCS